MEETEGKSGQSDLSPCFFPGLSGKIWSLLLGSHVQGQYEGAATTGNLAAKQSAVVSGPRGLYLYKRLFMLKLQGTGNIP